MAEWEKIVETLTKQPKEQGRIQLKASNLDNAKIAGMDLHGASFSHCSFKGAELAGVDFTEADLFHCDFTRANLKGAKFFRAKLRNCRFSQSQLDEAGMVSAYLERCQFIETQMIQADLTKITAKEVNFSQAKLEAASIKQSFFYRCHFNECNFFEVIANEAIFYGCDFRKAVINEMIMGSTYFIQCGLFAIMGKPFVFESSYLSAADTSASMDRSEFMDIDYFQQRWSPLMKPAFEGNFFPRQVLWLAQSERHEILLHLQNCLRQMPVELFTNLEFYHIRQNFFADFEMIQCEMQYQEINHHYYLLRDKEGNLVSLSGHVEHLNEIAGKVSVLLKEESQIRAYASLVQEWVKPFRLQTETFLYHFEQIIWKAKLSNLEQQYVDYLRQFYFDKIRPYSVSQQQQSYLSRLWLLQGRSLVQRVLWVNYKGKIRLLDCLCEHELPLEK